MLLAGITHATEQMKPRLESWGLFLVEGWDTDDDNSLERKREERTKPGSLSISSLIA